MLKPCMLAGRLHITYIPVARSNKELALTLPAFLSRDWAKLLDTNVKLAKNDCNDRMNFATPFLHPFLLLPPIE